MKYIELLIFNLIIIKFWKNQNQTKKTSFNSVKTISLLS